MFPKKRINAYIIRKQVNNVRETFEQVISQLPTRLAGRIRTNQTRNTIEFGKTRIECMGLVQSRGNRVAEKLGKARLPSDIQILFFDEAWEFSSTDFMNVQMAVADSDCRWLIWIGAANPYNLQNPFFEKLMSIVPYDLQKIKNEYDYYEIKGDTIGHWVCAYACWNEPWMGSETKNTIESAKSIDPITSDVVIWGKPLRLGGGIYNGYIPKIKIVNHIPAIDFLDSEIFCGIDVGYSNDPTAVVFGLESNGKVLIFNELIIQNLNRIFDETRTCFEIVRFLRTNWQLLRWRNQLCVFTDNDFAFADTLNRVANQQTIRLDGENVNFGDYIFFQRISDSYRKTRIRDRIKGVVRCLSNGFFYMMKGKGINLLKEFEISDWKKDMKGTTKEIQSRADGDDHSLNALEYGLREKIYSIGTDD